MQVNDDKESSIESEPTKNKPLFDFRPANDKPQPDNYKPQPPNDKPQPDNYKPQPANDKPLYTPQSAEKMYLCLGYQRTGSSYLADVLFNYNSDIHFLFEPLDQLYSSMYGLTPGWTVPGDITITRNGQYRSVSIRGGWGYQYKQERTVQVSVNQGVSL